MLNLFIDTIILPLFSESFEKQVWFQDPATPLAEGIIDIHHHVFFFLIITFIFVCYWLVIIMQTFGFYLTKEKLYYLSILKLKHNTIIELIWTIFPCVLLYLISVPSFLLLYSMDELIDPAITIKAVGHQWYWSYEYSDYEAINWEEPLCFDSYMLPTDELELGQLRLLTVDNPIVLPINTHIRVIVTAADVLHCWAVPSLGIKVDAVPGRLNQGSIFLKRLGVFHGQCSEICGVNHGFMPIVIKSVTEYNYITWIINKLTQN